MQKVLIITYYWPPAGGPGVQRWLNFVKYLPNYGIQPIVFIPENPTYPLVDESLVNQLPTNIKIIKEPIIEPYSWASIFSRKKTKRISSGIIPKKDKQSGLERLLLWVRGNFFIPDARKYWVRPSVKSIENILEKEAISTLITTGPPHSLHLIGLQLKKKYAIKWVADFRDPWTTIGYHNQLKLTKWAQKKHKTLEKSVLDNADTVVVTSKNTRDEFKVLTRTGINVITNGFVGEKPEMELTKKFTLSHIGSLLTDRNPEVLWEVLSEMLVEVDGFKNDLEIQLIGIVGDGVKESLNSNGLQLYLTEVGYVGHDKVISYQASSQVLLLLEIDAKKTRGIIPGKLFEYLKVKRPILAIGPELWEAGKMVEDHNAGYYFKRNDKKALRNILEKWYSDFKKGELICNSIAIEQYHRKALTKKLAEVLQWES
ncbi:glycosyl transferase family 1 [Croceivirga lutea]|uniref:glycosyl transferase family 1 n=1 Tax=Croceivirga lutea TaxID=1775167 RepID=UPI0016396BD1|nr:glycosyl transferase family 1 [Croceivirga lutea]GGG44005.1 glycosyl transferase family 1 [Croceivirga lutea]